MVGGRGKTCGRAWACAGAGAATPRRSRRSTAGLQHFGRQFAHARQEVLAMHGDAGGLQFGLEERLDLLDHHQGVGHLRQCAPPSPAARGSDRPSFSTGASGKVSRTCM
jgi:hypothetical protein